MCLGEMSLSRGVYPYLPLATNAPRTIFGDFIKSLTNFQYIKIHIIAVK